MRHFLKRYAAGMLAASMAVLSLGISPAYASYSDFEEITSHVSLSVPQSLAVTRPSQDTATTAESYYITGTSDPDQELTMNGQPVSGRGMFGSFGVYVALEEGENVFTFKNGQESESITITRGGSAEVATTDTLTQATPIYDVAVRSGDTITFTCVAPSGASVEVEFGGKTVSMKQNVAASDGVPARFTGEMKAPSVSGTQNMGQVTYIMTYRGKTTSYTSAGSLFVAGEEETLLVQMKDTSSSIFTEESFQSDFMATAKKGAVDYVAEIGESMYRLGMGGWVSKEVVQPLTQNTGYQNKVSDVSFSSDEKGESFVLSGTGSPVFTAYQTDEKLVIRFFHTSGISSIPVQGSSLFSDISVKSSEGATELQFTLAGNRQLWGYVVEYDGEGNTLIYCKYAPKLAGGDQPLAGITVALDPGHGGTDSGALGIASTSGPMEKSINYDTALAVQKRLEKLGATVVLTRSGDETQSLSDRMWVSQEQKADFFISLHCNSTAAGVNGLKPEGVEVYYYEDISASFAATVLDQIISQTGRQSRGAKYSNFKVTLNTYSPALLIEMGFLTNPSEYDELCSRQGIFEMANAIGDSIIAYLS